MAFFGQDIEQVRQLGTQLDSKASDIETAISQLTSAVQSVQWEGPDAKRFKSDWTSTHVPKLRQVIQALRDASQSAKRNADQQQQTSSNY